MRNDLGIGVLEYERIYFEVVIQTENGLYRRTVRTVQYNHTYSTWNNNILRNSPRNARPTHRQFKAASSPYYPHAKKHLTQVSSSLFASCHFCCCSFLACFFLGGSFFFLLLDRAIRVHLATMEYNNPISSACSNRSLRRVPGGPKLAGKTRRKPINKYERIKNIVYTAL